MWNRFAIATLGAILSVALLPASAEARWRMASSENFVIYADDSVRDLQQFSIVLERYHKALEVLTGHPTQPPSPSSRLTIFVVGSQRDIRRLAGGDNLIAGFYTPRASGSIAFVQDLRMTSGEPNMSMIVLLHEYAHHFAHASSSYALPLWASEGGAEFFASARFPSDGTLQIGRPAYHRVGDLFQAERVPIRQLLDSELYFANRGRGYDSFYGRSWLLYHYLTFSDARAGQLKAYYDSLREGLDAIPAAERAFGDLDQLERDLDDYLAGRRMNNLSFPAEAVAAGPAQVIELSEGMNAALPLMIKSQRGVTREMALELLPQLRTVSQRYPDDAGVLAALAEAEFDAGNDAEAIAAADRAIALDPSITGSYVQKGYALFRRAAAAEDPVAAYAEAMRPFTALNRIEPDHPLPLIYFYQSFILRGAEPTELARHALERASQLAPFDQDLTLLTSISLAQEGKIEIARDYALPVATSPHGGELAGAARLFRTALETATEGIPFEWEMPAEEPAPTTAAQPKPDAPASGG